MENFVPVLRFMVVSDVHVKDCHSVERERLESAIKIAYREARKSDTYKKLDAMAIVGDFADNGSVIQMEAVKSILDKNLDYDETQLIISPASHEYHTDGGVPVVEERIKNIFGCPLDNHYVINGCHFLSISPSHATNYNEQKIKWMADNLKISAEDGHQKPIFVFQHPHNTCTVYGSVLWGEDELMSTYMDYPQIIHFSGHSHAPINDPRSIHQQHITCLGTGTLSYFEQDEFDKMTGTFPPEESKAQAAQMLLVEVDKDNRVQIFPYDIITDSYFQYRWEIEKPYDVDSFKYTNARYLNAEKPYFDAKANIELVDVTNNTITVKYPQAKDDEYIYVDGYDITVRNINGYTVRKLSMYSEYYLRNMPEFLTVKIDKLDHDTEYEIEIKANSFWFTQSEPITLKCKIK